MTTESRLPQLTRKPWLRAFLLTSAVFGSGLIVGIVLTSAFLWQRAFDPFRQPPGFAIERIMSDMHDELLLSPEQTKQLEQVFNEHYSRMEAIRADVDPKMHAEFESLQKQVESILRPEQAARWNQRFAEMQKRFMRGPAPGGPMHGPNGPGFGPGPFPPGQGGPQPPPFPMPERGNMRPGDGQQPQPPGPPMQGMEQRPPNGPPPPGFGQENGPPPGGGMNGDQRPRPPEPPQAAPQPPQEESTVPPANAQQQ